MFAAFTAPQHRRLTYGLLAVFAATTIAAFVIGFDGNPVANTLARVASVALVLAVAHPWRHVREFKLLVYASGLGFIVFVALHGLFDWAAGAAAGIPVLAPLLQSLSAGAFLIAVFLIPVAFVMGLLGIVVSLWWDRRGARAPAAPS